MQFKNNIVLTVDEWGAFGRNFMNILPVAQYFNSFICHADVVKMANYTAFSGLLSVDPKNRTFKSPLFYTFRLFFNNCLGSSVDTYVDSDICSTQQYEGISYVDVSTVYSEEKNVVFINIVNRREDKYIAATIAEEASGFTGKATISEINSNDVKAPFTYNRKEQNAPVIRTVDVRMDHYLSLFHLIRLRKSGLPFRINNGSIILNKGYEHN